MSSSNAADRTATAHLKLAGPDWRLEAKITVPAGPTTLRNVLPVFQQLADASVAQAETMSVRDGKPISCTKGCGACCRQLVPISPVEARRLKDLVDEMPEPRRSVIRERFAVAWAKLESSGMLAKLNSLESWESGEGRVVGLEYFQLGIPCPFLEEESCSIYLDRPITCREYLVTTPAANCARPTSTEVHVIKMPLKVWPAVARCETARCETSAVGTKVPWVPLIIAPQWAAAHPEELPARPGPQWVQQVLGDLTGKKLADPVS